MLVRELYQHHHHHNLISSPDKQQSSKLFPSPDSTKDSDSFSSTASMFPLSSDTSFHFEILRNLAHARYFGADVNEVLNAASEITAGDFESFYTAFHKLATRVDTQAAAIDAARYPVSARDASFRAATYYRAADFYLHGDPADPRIDTLWARQTAAFNRAIALLPHPGERVTLQADGFTVPAIFFPCGLPGPRPTVILGNGFDGSQEEMLHSCGFAALERGFHVITYEGPGQPTVRRQQGLGFIHEWEKVVTPVVDYLHTRADEVDASRIGLVGFSMGGFLCLRAGAFEHRLAAILAVDGVYDVFGAYSAMGSKVAASAPGGSALAGQLEEPPTEAALRAWMRSGTLPTALRWGMEQGLWAFDVRSLGAFLEATVPMTLRGIEDRIECPVWVGEAQEDIFFKGQPEMVRDALGERATYAVLTAEEGAGNHCHVGANALMNQRLFDWFQEKVVDRD